MHWSHHWTDASCNHWGVKIEESQIDEKVIHIVMFDRVPYDENNTGREIDCDNPTIQEKPERLFLFALPLKNGGTFIISQISQRTHLWRFYLWNQKAFWFVVVKRITEKLMQLLFHVYLESQMNWEWNVFPHFLISLSFESFMIKFRNDIQSFRMDI